MSRLRIFAVDKPSAAMLSTEEVEAIAAELAPIGVRFSRWPAAHNLLPGAASEQVLAAYQTEIDALMQSGGYTSVDVVSMHPAHPNVAVLRQKFLSEHTHAEDEIRFFVGGSGLFTIRTDTQVFEVKCEANDLIHVPAGTRHWFDMGAAPFFIAIRVFGNPEGWVAQFTGDEIAERFPRFESIS
jgi:1,2-dihydroxy-3-keto-5-methylthiopentene dioxygenase